MLEVFGLALAVIGAGILGFIVGVAWANRPEPTDDGDDDDASLGI